MLTVPVHTSRHTSAHKRGASIANAVVLASYVDKLARPASAAPPHGGKPGHPHHRHHHHSSGPHGSGAGADVHEDPLALQGAGGGDGDDDNLKGLITGEGIMISEDEEYLPRPIDTSSIKLGKELGALVELLSKNSHNVWAAAKLSAGWRYAPATGQGKEADRTSDILVPWEHLTEKEKDSSRLNAMETVKAMLYFGYKFDLEPGRTAVDPSELTKRLNDEEMLAMKRK
jgi:hypothetical protein